MRLRMVITVISALIIGGTVSTQDTNPASSFRNLNKTEVSDLKQGKIIYRQPANWKDLSLPESSPFFKEIITDNHKVNHNYIAEVILILRNSDAQGAIPEMKSRLLAFDQYTGILYKSIRTDRYFELFDWINVTKRAGTLEHGSVTTEQYMNPFGEYTTNYDWSFSDDSLAFSGVNTSVLTYQGVRAVTPGNMIWRFKAYKQDEYTIFYGLGAIKCFDMFGTFRERLSVSFMGRIEAFFRYIYGQ